MIDQQEKCHLCNSSELRPIVGKTEMRFGCFGFDRRVVRCQGCGLVQLVPIWTAAELKTLYAQYSKKQDFKGARPKQTVTRYLDRYLHPADRILEIGCSLGDNLRRLRSRGFNAIGIDCDPTVCDGKVVLNYAFEEFAGRAEKFDFIYAIHVFEHITNPREFVRKLYACLNQNGRFLLEIPCVDDPLLKLYHNQAYNKFYWYPYHVFFYDPESLLNMFSGFSGLDLKVERRQRYGLINHLRWIILGRPGNLNFAIPLLDAIYKFVLIYLFKVSDTLVISGTKRGGTK